MAKFHIFQGNGRNYLELVRVTTQKPSGGYKIKWLYLRGGAGYHGCHLCFLQDTEESHYYIFCGLDWEGIPYTELGVKLGNILRKGLELGWGASSGYETGTEPSGGWKRGRGQKAGGSLIWPSSWVSILQPKQSSSISWAHEACWMDSFHGAWKLSGFEANAQAVLLECKSPPFSQLWLTTVTWTGLERGGAMLLLPVTLAPLRCLPAT